MASPPDSCPYAVLQVAPTASLQELRQAFRRLSKQVHPDTTSLPPQEAEPAFRRLQQAYALLSDPGRRQAYDALRLAAATAVAAGGPRPGAAAAVGTAPAARPRWAAVAPQRPEPVRRALSGGEWFALLLLGMALLLSLVLGVGLAWARGAELVRLPSWWSDLQVRRAPLPAGPSPVAPSSDLSAELSADSAVALPADASAAFPSEAPVFPADRSAVSSAGLASGLLAPDRPASQGQLGQPAAKASRVAASRVAARIPAVLPSADG